MLADTEKHALFSTIGIFFCGLLIVHSVAIYIYIATLAVAFVFFGLWRNLLLVMAMFIPLSLISMLLSLPFGTVEQAIQGAIRMFLLGLSAVPTSAIVHIDFTRSINKLGCPKWLSLGLLISLKFVGIIRNEMGQIRMAMRVRGMKYYWYHPSVIYRGFIMPLLMRLMSISDMLTLSLETRAYSIHSKEEIGRAHV